MIKIDDKYIEEIIRCKNDPKYCIEKYFRVNDYKTREMVNVNLSTPQTELINSLEANSFNIIKDYRVSFSSNTLAAYLAVELATSDPEDPKNILVVVNNRYIAQDFVDMVYDYISQLPRWFWGSDYLEDSNLEISPGKRRTEFRLPNGSMIIGKTISKDATRGYRINHFIMLEASHMENGMDMFGVAMSSLPNNAKSTIISQPNGDDDLFYELYKLAKNNKNSFVVTDLKWYEDFILNYDLSWEKDGVSFTETEFTQKSCQDKINKGYKPTSKHYRNLCQLMNNQEAFIAQELDGKFIKYVRDGVFGELNDV